MRERALAFGSHGGLVGILTEPDAPTVVPPVAAVFANVGMHHRVGPFRLYVDLARRLASSGFYVLRFDLSGFGDSEPRPGTMSDTERAVLDVREAMDLLAERKGIERFVLVGLCSGVDSTHAVAVDDPRVIGAVFIDGYTYPTAGFRARRWVGRYLQAGRWLHYTRRRWILSRLPSTPEIGRPSAEVFSREYPSRARFRSDVARMTSRGARLLFIFTGTVDGRYNARGQIFETLGPDADHAAIQVERMAAADHLFASTEHRAAVLDRICRWSGEAILKTATR